MNTTLGKLFIPQPKSKIKAKEGLEVGDYKFFTSSSVQNKFLNDYQYDEESLIFGTGGAASIHYCNEPFSTSTDCIVVYGNGNANLKMVYYYLSEQIHLLQDGFKGAGLQHISKNYILNIPIDLPDRSAQDKIVEIFDIVTQIIKILNSKLILLDQLVKSRFVEMFGDPESNAMKLPVVKMGELFTIGSSKRIYQNEQTKSGVPFLRISDLTEIIKTGNNVPSLYISEEQYENLKQNGYVPKSGDILVTARGTLGSCYIVKETDKFYFQDGMISWMYNMRQDVSSNYIYYLFHMPGFRKQFDSTIAGSTVSYLSITMLKKLEVLLPPLSSQNTFATFVQEIDKSKLAVKECLKKTEYLKASLMQEYFG